MPVAAPGEVVVCVHAAAVNFPDVLIVANQYQMSIPTPFTPGSEFAGVVTEVGEGATKWAVGDRVFGSSMRGAFAEYIAGPETVFRRVPDGVSMAAASGFWVAHATAYHALRSVAEVQPGEVVAVLGAAGGVGLAAVEVAIARGATVVACVSSADKATLCRERGAAHTVDYSSTDLRDALKAVAPGGIDVVIDPVGGPLAERALRAMKWGGRFVTVGFASGEIPRIPLNLVLLKGVVIKGFEMRTFAHFMAVESQRDSQELMALLASGGLVPHVSATFPLEQTAQALRWVADRHAFGKVVVLTNAGAAA